VILVDTSVWIDHLHVIEPALVKALEADQVAVHPSVIGELALGSIANRAEVLALLSRLRLAPSLTHRELISFVNTMGLWRRGLSLVDAHLLGSARLMSGVKLWTRDKRLQAGASLASVTLLTEEPECDNEPA